MGAGSLFGENEIKLFLGNHAIMVRICLVDHLLQFVLFDILPEFPNNSPQIFNIKKSGFFSSSKRLNTILMFSLEFLSDTLKVIKCRKSSDTIFPFASASRSEIIW